MRQLNLCVAELSEPLIRAIAWLFLAIGYDREGVELRLRGLLANGKKQLRLGRCVSFVGPSQRILIGQQVCVYGNSYFNANAKTGSIVIGDRCHIDQFCVLQGQGGLSIGNDCAISSGVIIYTQTNQDLLQDGTPASQQPVRYAPVSIGTGCLVGAGARILPGVKIGDNCTIGAGAVVTRNVEDGQVVVGVPARPLPSRCRESEGQPK